LRFVGVAAPARWLIFAPFLRNMARLSGAYFDDCAASYMDDLARFPPLPSSAEALHLFERSAQGDREARRRVVEGNLRLVVKRALRWSGRGVALGDLIQEGNLALLRAAESFDPSRGGRFSSYATHWIDRALQEALRRSSHLLSAPTRARRMATRLRRDLVRERDADGRELSADVLASRHHLDIDEARALLSLDEAPLPLENSADATASESLANALPCPVAANPREALHRLRRAQAARKALETLDPRERQIVELRFGLGRESREEKSLRDAGRETGLSQEGVRKIERRALAKLRAIEPLRLASAEG
jgi:RNA polymerase primary sigma factor